MKELKHEIYGFEGWSSTEIYFSTRGPDLYIYVEAPAPGYYDGEGCITLDINEAKELRDKISLMIEELERRAV